MSQPVENSNLSGTPVSNVTRQVTPPPRNVLVFGTSFAEAAKKPATPKTPISSGFRDFSGLAPKSSPPKSLLRTETRDFSALSAAISYPKIGVKSTSRNDQPIFTLGKSSKKITAAGVIFYKKVGDKIQLLIFKNNDDKELEDLGGKTYLVDRSPLDTVCREANEESKSVISKECVWNSIRDVKPHYIESCKYLLFIVEAPREIKDLTSDIFGDKEECKDKLNSWTLNRTVEWMNLEDFLDNSIGYSINPRLEKVLDVIKKIK